MCLHDGLPRASVAALPHPRPRSRRRYWAPAYRLTVPPVEGMANRNSPQSLQALRERVRSGWPGAPRALGVVVWPGLPPLPRACIPACPEARTGGRQGDPAVLFLAPPSPPSRGQGACARGGLAASSRRPCGRPCPRGPPPPPVRRSWSTSATSRRRRASRSMSAPRMPSTPANSRRVAPGGGALGAGQGMGEGSGWHGIQRKRKGVMGDANCESGAGFVPENARRRAV